MGRDFVDGGSRASKSEASRPPQKGQGDKRRQEKKQLKKPTCPSQTTSTAPSKTSVEKLPSDRHSAATEEGCEEATSSLSTTWAILSDPLSLIRRAPKPEDA